MLELDRLETGRLRTSASEDALRRFAVREARIDRGSALMERVFAEWLPGLVF